MAQVTDYAKNGAKKIMEACPGMTESEALRGQVLWGCLRTNCGTPASTATHVGKAPHQSWTGGAVEFVKATTRESRRALEQALPAQKITDDTLDAAFEVALRQILGPAEAAELDANLKYLSLMKCEPPGIDNGLDTAVAMAYQPGGSKAYNKLPYAEQLVLIEAEIERRGGLEQVNSEARARYEAERKEQAAKPKPTREDFINAGCQMNGMCRCMYCQP